MKLLIVAGLLMGAAFVAMPAQAACSVKPGTKTFTGKLVEVYGNSGKGMVSVKGCDVRIMYSGKMCKVGQRVSIVADRVDDGFYLGMVALVRSMTCK